MNILKMILKIMMFTIWVIAVISIVLDVYMTASDRWQPTKEGIILRDIAIIMWFMKTSEILF